MYNEWCLIFDNRDGVNMIYDATAFRHVVVMKILFLVIIRIVIEGGRQFQDRKINSCWCQELNETHTG